MAIEITDEGATIKVFDTVKDKEIFFNKRVTNVKRAENTLLVQDSRQAFEFEFKDVTVPSEANAADLADAIETMLETPTGISGINIVPESPSSASVTSVDGVIVPANDDRIWVSITNLGTKNVFLAFEEAAVLNNGVALIQNLGQVEFLAAHIGTGDIHAITTGGAPAVLSILETSTTP